MRRYFTQWARWILIVHTLICPLCLLWGRPLWALGIFIGSVWMLMNLLFTFRILEYSIFKRKKAVILKIFLVKFPLVYGAGALLLWVNIFPVVSFLIGMTLSLVTMLFCMKKVGFLSFG